MKNRADYIVLIVGLLLLGFAVPVQAQEKSFPITEEVSEPEHDRNADLYLSNEDNPKTSLARDSVAVKPSYKPAKEKSEKQSNEGEEALSFNFLYYIIQRFKMSDIMEE